MLIVYQYFEIDSPVHKIAINAYALVTILFLWKVNFFSLKMDSEWRLSGWARVEKKSLFGSSNSYNYF